jgi:hypothetical protein
MPYKNWNPNDVLTATDVNSYLMRQAVAQFPDYAAGVAAITSPAAGQTFATANGTVYVYATGLGWRTLGADLAYSVTGNAATVSTSETVVCNTLVVPNLAFPYRAHVEACCLFTNVLVAAQVDLVVRYNLTGSVVAATDPYLRRARICPGGTPAGSNAASAQIVASVDHPTGGPMAFQMRAATIAGTATVIANADWNQLQVFITPI